MVQGTLNQIIVFQINQYIYNLTQNKLNMAIFCGREQSFNGFPIFPD